MDGAGSSQPGFFGKLPARGDFVERRLDRGFCRALDSWLGACLLAGRERLGEAWLPAYLEAPIWRFAFAAGVCGPRATVGVMMPSVDRVGRYFPLVIAAHVMELGLVGLVMEQAEDWLDRAEGAVLAALEADCGFEGFDAAVAALGAPGLDGTAQAGAAWWHFGSETMAAVALISPGLPDAAFFPAFIDGDPGRWGWVACGEIGVAGLPVFDAG